MKSKLIFLSSSVLSLALIFTSCQKDADKKEDVAAEAPVHSDDQSRVDAEVDAIANDADIALEATGTFSGRVTDVQSIICNATITIDSVSNPRKITVVYAGASCIGNTTRTGTVVISMAQGVKWKNAGAAATITFQNLKITRVSDNKSITINGSKTYTNVSGGLLKNLVTVNPQIHAITSNNLSVTFDNGTQRTWSVAKQRTFTYSNGVVVSATGTHSENGINNIAEWGINRFGRAFTTSVTSPIVIKQDCNFRITSGALLHTTPLFSSTATFGLDANGNSTTCPGLGNYFVKIGWTGPAGNTQSVIVPY